MNVAPRRPVLRVHALDAPSLALVANSWIALVYFLLVYMLRGVNHLAARAFDNSSRGRARISRSLMKK